MKVPGRIFQLGMLLLVLVATGCGSLSASPGRKRAAGAETRLRVGDQLQIRLETGGQAGAASQLLDVVVDENGQVSLPLIGAVAAAGKTSSELAEQVQSRYVPQFYVRCLVSILTAQRFFYVGGEVRSSGRFPWTEDITLLKAINTAGGFSDYANRGRVEVSREAGGKEVFNCENLRRNPAQDVPIRPGDRIEVPRSFF